MTNTIFNYFSENTLFRLYKINEKEYILNKFELRELYLELKKRKIEV